MRRQKGCNCRRSECMKNYCDCYEANIACGNLCKCVGCRNVPLDVNAFRMANNLNSMPAPTMPTVNKTGKCTKTDPGPSTAATSAPIESSQEYNHLTEEVIDAALQCMITQASECEKSGLPASQTEKLVIEELGRCLLEITALGAKNSNSEN